MSVRSTVVIGVAAVAASATVTAVMHAASSSDLPQPAPASDSAASATSEVSEPGADAGPGGPYAQWCPFTDVVHSVMNLYTASWGHLPTSAVTPTNLEAGWRWGGGARSNYDLFVNQGRLPPGLEQDAHMLMAAMLESKQSPQRFADLVVRTCA